MAAGMWDSLGCLVTLILCCVGCSLGKQNIVDLNEENWKQILTKEWMVEFYAPWCPACKALQPLWEEFSTWGDDLGISVGQVDVTTSPGLSGRFMVTALPTIYHVLDGEFRQYRGARDKDSFISFIEEQKWKSIEVIPGWKYPGSFQMSVVAHFFKLSQLLRVIHNKLMEDYGLPTWGSYVIFAIATILIGAALGLLLVCIIDLIYPPKPSAAKMMSLNKPKGREKQSDNENEEDEDDDDEDDDDDDDELINDDLVDEEVSDAVKNSGESDSESKRKSTEENSPNIRKRKPRKVD